MNEEAINDAYKLFVRNGYSKSPEEFRILMNRNENARRDMYDLFVGEGYSKSPEEFNVLMGVQQAPSGVEAVEVDVQEEGPLKKKEDTVSPSGLSSLGLPSVTDVIQEKAELGEQQIAEQQIAEQEAADFFDVSKPFAPKPKQMQEKMQMQENLVMVRQYDDFDIRGVNRGPIVQVNLNDPDLYKRKENQRLYVNQLESEAKSELNKIALDKDVTEKTSEIEKEVIRKKKELEKTNYLSAGPDGKPIEITTFEEVVSGIKPTEGLDVDLSAIGTDPQAAKVLYDAEVKRYEDKLKKDAGFVKVNGEYYDPNMLPPDVGFDAAIKQTRFVNIIDSEEEFSVPTMRLRFKPYGFQFEETGGGDAMKVTAPNGQVEEFNLDPTFGDTSEAIRLKKFLVNGYNDYADTLSDQEFVEQALKGMPLEYQSTKDAKTQALRQKRYIREVSKKMEKDAQDLDALDRYREKEETNIFLLNKELENLNPESNAYKNLAESIQKRVSNYNKTYQATEAKHKELILQHEKLKNTVGQDIMNGTFSKDNDYSSMREDMGDISSIPATVISEFGYGIGDVLSGTTSLTADLIANINNAFYNEYEEGYITDSARKKFKKDNLPGIRNLFGGAIAEGAGLTEEYVQKAKESGGIITEGLFGLVRSMPAMMTGGASMFSFMAMGTDMINQEMENNPAFANISENEKLLLTVPVGIVIGVLERAGFRGALNNSSLVGRLTVNGLTKFGLSSGKQIAKAGTKRTFTEIIENEVKNKLVRGGVLLASSTFSEAETGAAQEIAEVFGKEIYDAAKGQDYFKQSVDLLNPTTEFGSVNWDFLGEVAHAAAAEAVGGFAMGMPSAFTAANRSNKVAEISDNAYNLFRMYRSNPEILELQKKNLDARAADPKDPMTKEEADKTMLDYEYMIGQASEINPEFDSQAQKQILALMMQQREIKDAMQNKDKRTTKELQRQSEIIDEDITLISAEAHKRANVQKGEYETAVKEGYKGTFDDYRTGKDMKEAIKKEAAKKKVETKEEITPTKEQREKLEKQALRELKKENRKIRRKNRREGFKGDKVKGTRKKYEPTQEDIDARVDELFQAQQQEDQEVLDLESAIEEEVTPKEMAETEQVAELTQEELDNLWSNQSSESRADLQIEAEEQLEKEEEKKSLMLRSMGRRSEKKRITSEQIEARAKEILAKKESAPISATQTQEKSKPVAEAAVEEVTQEKLDEVRALEEEAPVVEEEVTTEEAPVTKEEQADKDKARAERLAELDRNLREATTEKAPIAETQEVIEDGKVPEVTQEQQDRYNNNEMSEQEIKDVLVGLNTKVQMRAEGKTEEKVTAFEKKIKKENENLYREVLGMRAAPKTETKVETPKKEAPKKEAPKKDTGVDDKLRAIAVKKVAANKEKKTYKTTKAEQKLINDNKKQYGKIFTEEKMPTTTADGIRSAITMVEDSFKEKEAKIKEQIKTIDGRVTDRMTKDKERKERKDTLAKARKEKNAKVKELKGKLTDMGAQFQLEAEATSEKAKAKLLEEANKLLDDVIQENNGEISENPFNAENPAPGAEIITIEVKENSKLIEGLERMGLKDLVGKKISLVMADQLKVDDKRMGGPFFPLIPRLRGKVAWASINKTAASGIVNGAIKSDYSVVYNMSPSAIDSNSIMGETLIDLLNALPKSEKQETFELMKENVLKSKAKDFVRIKEVFESSKTLSQAMKGLQKLGVDERAALLKKVVPSRDVKAGTGIGVKLQENNITIEGLREMNAEQFVADLPAGAMTMVLEVTDKAGNKITKKTKDEALITPEQQKEEGLPEHPNYPVYIRGRAVGILTETTPFFNVLKDVARNLEVKLVGLVKKKSGRKITSKEARSNEMRSASMKASKSRKVQSPTASSYEKFVAVLKRTFPSVEVLTSQEEFDALLKETGTKKLTKKNQKVYGAVYQGKLYLNPSLENFNTPIHEFGHIWMNVAKESAPEIYKKGMDLIKGTDYEAQVRNNPAYQKVIKQMTKDGATEQEINDYVQEEALATAIGDKGESFVKAAQKKNFKEWLNTLYGFVKKLTGISKLSAEQLKTISLNEFLQAVSVDLLSGEQLFEGAEVKDMGDALQLMADEGIDLKGDMQTVINKAREDGFKDAEIKGVLQAIGYKARNINEALKIEIETDVTMPSIFGNIEGGAVKGQEMFTRLREEVAKFAKNNSPAKTREKAMELLREDPTYKEQSDKTKLELVKEFDKTLKSKANAKVRQEIAGIKQRIKDVITGEVGLQEAKTRLKNLIKDTLPKSREYSQADINRLNRIVDKATPENYQAAVTAVLKEVNKFRGEQRESKLKKILKDIQAKAKQSRKSGARVAAEDQPFFKQAAVLINAAIDGNAEVFDEIAKEMTEREAEIFELFDKVNNNEELTEKERELFAKAQAFEMLGKINNQELEALDDVIADIKAETKASRERLKGKRLARKEIYDSLREQANKDISEGYPYLFDEVVNEDGSTSLVPLNDAQLRARREQIKKNLLKDGKLVKNVRQYLNLAFATEGKVLKGLFANYLKHLGTLTNGLDRKGNFFTENIYKRLNRMEENNLKGYFNTTDAIDNNINTIDGIDKGLDGLYKMLNDSFSSFKEDKLKLNNVRLGSTNVIENFVTLNKDEAARIIAISRNDEQRDRLEKQGIGKAEIKKLEEFIGAPAVKAVDKIVDYLSSTYYESINKVYEDVNDVSLNYVENYFPVKTISEKTDKKKNAELATSLQQGEFSKVFSAQQASALKERNNTKNPIAITGFSFTQELDTHITEMERFKSYAKGTKELNVIMNHTPSVKKLLDATNLDSIMTRGVGYAINPNAMQDLFRLNNPIFSRLQEKFTGVALALKFIQLPKQATSFVNAFADYQLFDKGVTGKGRIPIIDSTLDFLAFMAESGWVAFFQKRSTFKQAMDVSANFRNRMRQSFKTADLAGLETGQRATYGSGRTRRTRLKRIARKAKIIANSPTLVGDAAGVMGYMVAYRNNIRKGMSPEEALERFNDYNATQQTRRATEKIGLQYDSNMIVRSFTMFGSTLFLQLNKVMQSATNIRRGTANAVTEGSLKEMPSTKEYRELFLNLGVANVLFALTANIFKYNPFADPSVNPFLTGDDGDDDELTEEQMDRISKAKNALKRGKKISSEDQMLIDRYQINLDKEQVLESYKEAMFGINQLYNLPLIGGTVNTAVDTWWWGYSDAIKKPRSRYTDPISQIFTSSYYDMVIGDKGGFETAVTRIVEYGLGIPSKTPLAAVDQLRSWFDSNDTALRKEYEKKDEDGERIAKEESFEKFKENRYEENMYDLLGVSYSYRPGSAKSKDIIYVPIEVNKRKKKDEEESSDKKSRPKKRKRRKRIKKKK